MFSTLSWLREMEEAEWNLSDASRARKKGAAGHLFLSLYQKGFQDVLQSFRIPESQEDVQPLHLAPAWEQSIPLFSGELRSFLPVDLGSLDWSSRERSLSGCLVESLVSGFVIHLRVSLIEEEGDAFMGALGVDRMEDHPVVEMVGDMEVVNAEFECRD